MKKLLFTLSFLLEALSATIARADDVVTVDSIEYTISGDTAIVTGHLDGITKANIVESVSYNGKQYPVTTIGGTLSGDLLCLSLLSRQR